MTYFTKEFYNLVYLSYANDVKTSKVAEKMNERFYRRMYDKICAIWVNNDRRQDMYRDPVEDLRKIDEYINEPNISEEERARRIEFKKNHIALHKNEGERKIYEFDEEMSKRQFEQSQLNKIEIYKSMPKEITEKIADIRLFALGYASAEVKRLLRTYCADLRRTVKRVQKRAYAETDKAEGFLSERIGFNEYDDVVISGIEERNGDIYLKGEDNTCLIFKNGRITEGAEKPVYPYSKEPNTAWSRIATAELHREKHKFQANFLIINCNEINTEEPWYLTVEATDIWRTPTL